MAHIGAGLMGPTSENVETIWFFKICLKGQDGPEDARGTKDRAANSGFGVALGTRR